MALAASAALAGATPGRARAGLLPRRNRRAAPPAGRELDEAVGELTALYWPILQNLGFSGCAGYASAFALKVVGRGLAAISGLLFFMFQVAACQGFITVDWTRVHTLVIRGLDVNRDGRLDASDLRALTASALAVLSQGMPSIGGFLGGFALGLR